MKLACAFVLLLASWQTPAAALTIRGDAGWREDPACSDGWQDPATDDRNWQAAGFPWQLIRPTEWALDPQARPMWGRQAGSPTCVRRVFQLTQVPAEATAHIWVDDDYEFYVNGIHIGASRDGHAAPPGETYAIAALLRPGANVVALRLIDTGGSMAALFSLSIPGEAGVQSDTHSATTSVWPWLLAGLLVVSIGLWRWSAARVARHYGRLGQYQPAEHVTALAVLVAGLVQGLLAITWLYSGEREIPVLVWNLPGLVALVLLLWLLAVLCHRLPETRRSSLQRTKELLLLLLVMLLGLGLRSLWIDSIPSGFFQDEATNGNDAYTLGQQPDWYLWSDSVGGRPTLFLYLLHAATATFGASYTSLKIAPVAIGTLTIGALYFFARIGFGARVALWAAFLLAVSRWHIHYSRMAWEAILLPLFSVAGFALLLYGMQFRRWARTAVVAAAVVLAAGLYSYAAYRAVPVVVLTFLLWTLLSPQRSTVLRLGPTWFVAMAAALAVVFPLLRFAWLQPDLYWARYSEVSLTDFMRYYGTPLPWFEQIGRSLLSLNGVGDEIIRHNLPYAPQLDPITGVLFLVGAGTCLWRTDTLAIRFVWAWFATYLALASLTCDGPHATRLLGLVPVAVLLAAIGIEQVRSAFWTWGSDRMRRLALLGVVAAITGVNGYQYFVLEARHPTASVEFNTTGRSLCEYISRQNGVEVYWTSDIAFWADGQCLFLARGRYTLPRSLQIGDLQADSPLLAAEVERVLVIGPEMVQAHPEMLQPHGDELRTALPEVFTAVRDQDDRVLYWLAQQRPAQRALRRGAGP